MMDPQDETLLEYIQDYRIHLIDPARLTEEELGEVQEQFTGNIELCEIFERQRKS